MFPRRAAFLLLALLAALVPAQGAALADEAYVADVGGGSALVAPNGDVLVAPGALGTLYALNDDSFISYIEEDGALVCALVSADGEPLTGYEYDFMFDYGEALVCSKGGKVGVIDCSGATLIEPVYTDIVPNGEGGYLALTTDPNDDSADGVYRLAADGSETATGVKIIGPLMSANEGLMPAQSPDNGLYGYLNAKGQWKIRPQYEWCGVFYDGAALANAASGAGLIDKDGNWLITPVYDFVSAYGDSVIICEGGGEILLFSPDTYEQLASYPSADTSAFIVGHDAVAIMNASETLLLERDGSKLATLPAGYTPCGISEDEPRAVAARANGMWGDACCYLYSPEGERIAGPYQYLVEADANSFIFASFDTQSYEYPEYGVSFMDEVPNTRRAGLIDSSGKVLVEPVYRELYLSGSDMLYGRTDDEARLLTLDGEIVAAFSLP